MQSKICQLDLTTQGPTYPPSEVMDEDGNFIVIGAINMPDETGGCRSRWGRAIVSVKSILPEFGKNLPYDIVEEFNDPLPDHIGRKVLYTLPLPLPCTNYPMLFSPEQYPNATTEVRPSYAFHETPIPDLAPEHGRQLREPVTLADWVRAQGELTVSIVEKGQAARFEFIFRGLLPLSLYTIMSLRKNDLDPQGPTRPGPLGVPNVFVTDRVGFARYDVILPNPFPDAGEAGTNRIMNVVVLWMSYQMSHGGAIGRYGLGGDIHAQLKFNNSVFDEFITCA